MRKDGSVTRQWEQLKSYEVLSEQRDVHNEQHRSDAKSNKEKIKKMKSSANKKISSFKTHISDFYRWQVNATCISLINDHLGTLLPRKSSLRDLRRQHQQSAPVLRVIHLACLTLSAVWRMLEQDSRAPAVFRTWSWPPRTGWGTWRRSPRTWGRTWREDMDHNSALPWDDMNSWTAKTTLTGDSDHDHQDLCNEKHFL